MNNESTTEGAMKTILDNVCEHCFQLYLPIDAPKHKDGKCNEICVNCGLPLHPNIPCEEAIAYTNHTDSEYFRLLRLILDEGRWTGNRTGVDTLAVFGAQAKFDVDMNAFPILTTKKVWFKGIVHELLWFIKGDTNIKYLVDNDVHIWDSWAYKRHITASRLHRDKLIADGCEIDYQEPTMETFIEAIKVDDSFATKHGELGEGTYGSMWRAFPYYGEEADGDQYGLNGATIGVRKTVDQLKKVLDKLHTNPTDRRMIVSAWHPYWVDHCALPPCHCLFHFNTQLLTLDERRELYIQKGGDLFPMAQPDLEACFDTMGVPSRKLNLLLYQRSCDTAIGIPYNVTSYALLLAMMSQCVNMIPGVFTHTYGDLHIYRNHMDGIKEQLTRSPRLLPKLWLNPEVKDIFSFRYEDIKLIGYNPHPTIKFPVAV